LELSVEKELDDITVALDNQLKRLLAKTTKNTRNKLQELRKNLSNFPKNCILQFPKDLLDYYFLS